MGVRAVEAAARGARVDELEDLLYGRAGHRLLDDLVQIFFGDQVAKWLGLEAFDDAIRYRGPVTLRPTVWIIDGRRLIKLGLISEHAIP